MKQSITERVACTAVIALTLLLSFTQAVFAQAKSDDSTIKIGRSFPLTGPLAPYGIAKKVGGDAYLERINREGGVRGKKLEIITLEDRYDPKETTKNIATLNDGKVLAMLGLFGVPTVAAALPVIEELKLPAVGLTSGAALVRNPPRRYAFPTRASYLDETDTMVQHFNSLGLKRVAIVRQANPFGASVAENMLASLTKASIKPTVNLEIAADGANVKAVTKQLTDAGGVDVVFLAMLSNVALIVVDEMRTANVQTAAGIFSISAVDTTVLASKLKDKARGVAISQVVPLMQGSTPIVRDYVRDLKVLDAAAAPSFYGLEAYIEARILIEGIKRIPAASPLSREALVTALESFGELEMGGITVSYGPGKHNGFKFVELTMISRNGSLVR